MFLELPTLADPQRNNGNVQKIDVAFNDAGASHALRSTKGIMKMYRNPFVCNDSGVSYVLRSTKEIMDMYGNSYVFNDYGTPTLSHHKRNTGKEIHVF